MEFNTFLADHHGVITKAQALSFGLTGHQITYRVRSGRWLTVGPGVYRLAVAPDSWWARARAAALSSRGLISHRSALRNLGVDGYEHATRIDVTVGEARRVVRPEHSRLHRSTAFLQADGRLINGIPTTGIERAVLDVASQARDHELDQIIDAVLRQRLATVPGLIETVERHGRQGRRGAGRLMALLDCRRPEDRVPDSRFNRLIGQLLVDSGLPEPVFEFEVRQRGKVVGRADLAYPSQRLLIECDSARWHHNRQSFTADPRRRNRLVVLGYQVVNFTWDDYRHRPAAIVTTTRAMLNSQAA